MTDPIDNILSNIDLGIKAGLEKAKDTGDWISVETELPKTDIGDGHYGNIEVIVYDGDSVFATYFEEGNTVTYWSRFKADNVICWQYKQEPPNA